MKNDEKIEENERNEENEENHKNQKYKNVLFLSGSPKKSSGTSDSFGSYMASRLAELGLSIEKEYIYKLIRSEEGQQKLLSKVNTADLIILAFPLYVDSLPAGIIYTLELIADSRKTLNPSEKKEIGFTVLINCGFPEEAQNATALAICKIFAREVEFEWKGALSFGMGGVIGGKDLEKLGGMVRNITSGINIAAQALVDGKDIPEEAIELVAKPMMPRALYTKMGNLGWKREAKKFGAHNIIKAKPYL